MTVTFRALESSLPAGAAGAVVKETAGTCGVFWAVPSMSGRDPAPGCPSRLLSCGSPSATWSPFLETGNWCHVLLGVGGGFRGVHSPEGSGSECGLRGQGRDERCLTCWWKRGQSGTMCLQFPQSLLIFLLPSLQSSGHCVFAACLSA